MPPRGSCTQTRVRVSAAIDAEASLRDLLSAALHLSICAGCRREVRSLVLVTRLLRASR
jgi:hypothetical protein